MPKYKELPPDWREFVEASEAISGIAPFKPERDSTKRHMEIALILANAAIFLDPRQINSVLTRRTGEWFRGGIEAGQRGRAPPGDQLPVVFAAWVDEVESGIERLTKHPMQEREAFCWAMHLSLMCIHAFKEGNGRTARLTLNHLRTLLCLPVAIIRLDEADDYFKQLDRYREEVFLSNLVHT